MNKYIDLYTHSLKVKQPVARVSVPRQAKPLNPKAGILTEGHVKSEEVKFAPNGGWKRNGREVTTETVSVANFNRVKGGKPSFPRRTSRLRRTSDFQKVCTKPWSPTWLCPHRSWQDSQGIRQAFKTLTPYTGWTRPAGCDFQLPDAQTHLCLHSQKDKPVPAICPSGITEVLKSPWNATQSSEKGAVQM